MTTKTIQRVREVGFDPSQQQKEGCGAGWASYLSAAPAPSPEQANKVLAKIVSAAAGEMSQNGSGFCLSVSDAAKRVEAARNGKSKPRRSPPEVIVAFTGDNDPAVRKLAYLGYEWDFTEEQPPPLHVRTRLGGQSWEQDKYIQYMQRLARKTLEAKAEQGGSGSRRSDQKRR
jgi:hypothetical protein